MKRLYEGMILTDTNKAREDSAAVEGELRGIIERFGGRVVNLEKWEERKLTYEIRGTEGKHRRATFYLTHFEVDADQIARIERGLALSPIVLRALILRDVDGTDIIHIKDYEEFNRQQDEGRGERRGGGRRPASPRSGRDRSERDKRAETPRKEAVGEE